MAVQNLESYNYFQLWDKFCNRTFADPSVRPPHPKVNESFFSFCKHRAEEQRILEAASTSHICAPVHDHRPTQLTFRCTFSDLRNVPHFFNLPYSNSRAEYKSAIQ